MDNSLCFILAMALIGWLIVQGTKAFDGDYRRGKREGSRKGYHAGYQQAKKDSNGCCFSILLIFGTCLAASMARSGTDEQRNDGSARDGGSTPITALTPATEVPVAAVSDSSDSKLQTTSLPDATEMPRCRVPKVAQSEVRPGSDEDKGSMPATTRKYAVTSVAQLLKTVHQGDIGLDLSGSCEVGSPADSVPEYSDDQPLKDKCEAVVALLILKSLTVVDDG